MRRSRRRASSTRGNVSTWTRSNLIRSAATSARRKGSARALRAATWLSDGAEGVGFAALFDSSRVGPGAASRILRAIAARIALSRGMADDANRLAWLEDSLEDARTFCETTLRPAAGSAGASAGLAEDVLACLRRAAQKAPPKGRNFSETERKTALFAAVKLMRVARTNSAAPALESALTWYLGENANFLAGEFAWNEDDDGSSDERARDLMDETSPSGARSSGASLGSCAALDSGRNPALSSTIATLVRCLCASARWATRRAAIAASSPWASEAASRSASSATPRCAASGARNGSTTAPRAARPGANASSSSRS